MSINTITRKELTNMNTPVQLEVFVVANGQPVVGETFTTLTKTIEGTNNKQDIKDAAFDAIMLLTNDVIIEYNISRNVIVTETGYAIIVKFNDMAADDIIHEDYSAMSLGYYTKVPGTEFTYGELREVL